MSTRTVELVSEWDSVPFDGGYDGLRTLANQDFSGAVVSGAARLFMLSGTVVGILDGDLDDFEDASGTARQAPHDALPLLAVMEARADQPRAQYYTEETALAEVDRTLTDGNFTGFVELSENVLSGDYYLLYHQGRSMSVAWVGTTQRLITDEEAFEQANDEVGIYQVMPAEISPIELPPAPGSEETTQSESPVDRDARDEPQTEEPSPTPATEQPAADSSPPTETDPLETSNTSNTAASTTEQTASSNGPPGSKATGASHGTAADNSSRQSTPAKRQRDTQQRAESPTRQASAAEQSSTTDNQQATDRSTTESQRTAETDTQSRQAKTVEQETASRQTDPEPSTRDQRSDTDDERRGRTRQTESAPQTESNATTKTAQQADDTRERDSDDAESTHHPDTESTQPAGSSDESVSSADLETRSIPSLDPGRSNSTQQTSSGWTPPKRDPDTATTEPEIDSEAETTRATERANTTRNDTADTTERAGASPEQPNSAPVEELQAQIANQDTEIEQLETRVNKLSATNDELRAERDRLQSDLDTARTEIQQLQDQLEDAATAETPAGRELSPSEAIDGTNLFVRYDSKGGATLANAKDGNANRDDVEANLRLEYHTQFDADETVVDGVEFEMFLHDSIQYRFVDWLVGSLLYEIRDTGHASAMSELYEAVPKIDRADLNGTVSVAYTEDNEQHRTQEQFDVVVRDRMGNPLLVANINDSREPATDGQMTDILRDAERVGNVSDALSAAFLVTSSFFEPESLETAEEATSSGLFSRDKRKSFVNLSRKGGYHLCLLEARNKDFHLAVPEL